ncbi:hypothetical protein Tco_1482415 [Tanacetum coccineum]
MAPPTCTDDQILPRIRWVPIGKSNCYLDIERSQSNPIYKITVDILKHTNFFRAFTASSTIPSIYIQQFWDTIRYDKNTGSYRCQLDDQWFNGLPESCSPLHLPNEEPVLGYLKFSAKGTNQEVFGVPILNDLITDDIRGEQYYNAYLEKVAKHQRYLVVKEVSDPDSPAPKLELEQHMVDMVEANQALEERLDKQGNRLYNLENLDISYKVSKAVDEIVTDAVDWAIQAPLRDRFRDLPEANMKEILNHRIKKKKRHVSPKTPLGSPPHQPPPPPPPADDPDTYTENPIKGDFFLRWNLPVHRSVLTDSEVHVKMEMEIPRSSAVNS